MEGYAHRSARIKINFIAFWISSLSLAEYFFETKWANHSSLSCLVAWIFFFPFAVKTANVDRLSLAEGFLEMYPSASRRCNTCDMYCEDILSWEQSSEGSISSVVIMR